MIKYIFEGKSSELFEVGFEKGNIYPFDDFAFQKKLGRGNFIIVKKNREILYGITGFFTHNGELLTHYLERLNLKVRIEEVKE